MYSFTLTHCFFFKYTYTIDRGYYMISFIKKVLLTTSLTFKQITDKLNSASGKDISKCILAWNSQGTTQQSIS